VNAEVPSDAECALTTIVSGGQTGADRAALDWAITKGIPHGGWCPRGRRAEDGKIPDRYHLHPSQGTQYAQRTEWNVRDSDGTVVFTIESHLHGGSKRAVEFAREYRKPWLHLSRTMPVEDCAERLRDFVVDHKIAVLNVAGSRASVEPDIGEFVQDVLTAFWELLRMPQLAEHR
jgi:hypothetical protein